MREHILLFRYAAVGLVSQLCWHADRRMWIVSAHQRRRRRVPEVSGLNPVQRCLRLANRWRACGYGLEGQEISDAEKPQYLPFNRADAAAGLVVIQAR